ncbi:MAG: carbon starvation protein A [Paludibacteraceae bacterium]|nr:carbon starvation protein A [Paludibacteraceae bacterium]
MITFIFSIVILVLGYLLYGKLVEKVFMADAKRPTPATQKEDGVDYVPLSGWRIFLIQFLNIAGLGPIFGAIMGIFFGPSAFLWIVFGTIFAGGVHDYLSGMMSVRKGGASLPEIVGSELGMGVRQFMRVLSLVLLVLLTTTFMSGPAALLHGLVDSVSFQIWLLVIFGYYMLATLLPIDKLIGQFYPVFGAVLLFMGVGIMVVMLGWHGSEIPELTDGLQNRQTNGLPLFPMMFVSIACGAISGFHGTQSPLMARCITNERQGRWIFYGAMVAEGILALIWAAAAGTFFADPEQGLYGIDGLQAFAAEHRGENIAALVVDRVSRSWLGVVGGILAIIGVIAAPITSGDTALRSARLIVADFLHLEQKTIWKRLVISVPLFGAVFGMTFVNFDIVWRYFSWTNQTLAVFTLWAGTVFLFKNGVETGKMKRGWLMSIIPALFMTMVSVSYIFIAPEGFHLQPDLRWIGYMAASVVTVALLFLFAVWAKRYSRRKPLETYY